MSIRACLAGQRVQFATATQWVTRLSDAKRNGLFNRRRWGTFQPTLTRGP